MGINTWINLKINSKSKELLEEYINDIEKELKEELNKEEIWYDEEDKLYIYSYSNEIYNGYKLQYFLEEKQEEYGEKIEVYFGCVNIEDVEMKKL